MESDRGSGSSSQFMATKLGKNDCLIYGDRKLLFALYK
jgi:hypothetical protein